jgi:hypothetical protein
MLAALSPLFRYSDWRDAWVLRLIGERFGPVLVRAELELEDEYQSPSSRLRRRVADARWSMSDRVSETQFSISERASRTLPLRGSGLILTLAAAFVLAAAALGFTVARSGAGGGAAPALTGHASAGLLRLSVPPRWRRETSPVAVRLGLTDGIARSPSRSRGEMLVVGRTVTPDPQLLPRTLLASLPSVPTPQTVSLGHATFYRYLNLSPRDGPSPESVYAMSTTIGTVLGLCIAPTASVSFTSSCERSLATLTLGSGRALPPGPIPAYAANLNLAIKQLNDVRSTAGTRLRTAPAATVQAQAADALAAAYAQAAATLSHLNAGPAGAANSAVVAALALNETAYRALGRAASLQDSASYSAASTSLRRAASALTAAYSGLDAFGYSVS